MSEKSKVYKELKETFPQVAKITINYSGSGDDFGDFWNADAEDTNGDDVSMDDHKFLNIAREYLFEILDNSEANFNDDGSEGTIELDLENMVTTIDNYEVYRESRATGKQYY